MKSRNNGDYKYTNRYTRYELVIHQLLYYEHKDGSLGDTYTPTGAMSGTRITCPSPVLARQQMSTSKMLLRSEANPQN